MQSIVTKSGKIANLMRLISVVTGVVCCALPSPDAYALDLRNKTIIGHLYMGGILEERYYISKDGSKVFSYSASPQGVVHGKNRTICTKYKIKYNGRTDTYKACGKFTIKGDRLVLKSVVRGMTNDFYSEEKVFIMFSKNCSIYKKRKVRKELPEIRGTCKILKGRRM